MLAFALQFRHFLVAADEVSTDKMERWLAGVPAKWGTCGQDKLIDCTCMGIGGMQGGKQVGVFTAYITK